jgi:microcompartment protein CcmK/EutM
VPTLVQPAAKNSGTGTTLTVTLPNPTSSGSCLFVRVLTSANTNGHVSGITLGGSADNFGVIASQGTSTDHAIVTCWADPACAAGQTSVVITTTGSAGTQAVSAIVSEYSGMPATLAGMLDKSGVFTSSGFATSWALAAASPPTTQASELWLSIVGGNVSAVTAGTYTGPGSLWTNTALNGVNNYSGGFSAGGVAGDQVVSATGSPAYNGTASPTSTMDGLIVALKAAAAASAAAPAPLVVPQAAVMQAANW